MKLFRVDYMDDNDLETYLTVGESKEEVEEREKKKLQESLSCFMFCFVYEIDEVDGYKIEVKNPTKGSDSLSEKDVEKRIEDYKETLRYMEGKGSACGAIEAEPRLLDFNQISQG